MTVQLAASLESMTHTERIIYYRVGGHDFHLKAWQNAAVSHYLVFESLDLPFSGYGLLQNLIMTKKDKRKITLPFSASGARTSKIISFFSCSVCFWKRRTSSSAILVEANCSLLDSENTRGVSQACHGREKTLFSTPFRLMITFLLVNVTQTWVGAWLFF